MSEIVKINDLTGFQKRRNTIVKKLYGNDTGIKMGEIDDKSLKHSVDLPIEKLICLLNQDNRYISTSCCSGRLVVFVPDGNGKKNHSRFLYVEHGPITLESMHNKVLKNREQEDVVSNFLYQLNLQLVREQHVTVYGTLPKTHFTEISTENWVWFHMEPFIVHLECQDMQAGDFLLKVFALAGIKTFGIKALVSQRIMFTGSGSNKLYAPIGKLIDNKFELIVSKEYLKQLIQIANEKWFRNQQQIDELYKCFLKQSLPKIVSQRFCEIPSFDYSSISTAASSKEFFICFFHQNIFQWHVYIYENQQWCTLNAPLLSDYVGKKDIFLITLCHDKNIFLLYEKPCNGSYHTIFITVTLRKSGIRFQWDWKKTLVVLKTPYDYKNSFSVYPKPINENTCLVYFAILYKKKDSCHTFIHEKFRVNTNVDIQTVSMSDSIYNECTLLSLKKLPKENHKLFIWYQNNFKVCMWLPLVVKTSDLQHGNSSFLSKCWIYNKDQGCWICVPVEFPPLDFSDTQFDVLTFTEQNQRILILSKSMFYFFSYCFIFSVNNDLIAEWRSYNFFGSCESVLKTRAPASFFFNNASLTSNPDSLWGIVQNKKDTELIEKTFKLHSLYDTKRNIPQALRCVPLDYKHHKLIPLNQILTSKNLPMSLSVDASGFVSQN
jgi:tRNA(Phe) wybutosine-synthesizing methylase Tyw3